MAVNLGTLFASLKLDTSGMTAGIKLAKRHMQQFGNEVRSHMGDISAGAGLLGVSMGAVSAATLTAAKSAVIMAANYEQVEIAMKTMLGSTEAATKMLKQLQQFANQTPFEFPELVDASRRMLAFGFASKDVLPVLNSVGNAVAAMGGGGEMIRRVTLALGQMAVKGRVTGEEMMQLTEAGLKGWQYLAKGMGISTAEAMKLSEKGAIGAKQAITAIVEGMNKDFGGAMNNQSTTLAGLWSTIKDTGAVVMRDFGTTIVKTFDLKSKLASGMAWLDKNKAALLDFGTVLLKILGFVGAAVKSIVGVFATIGTAVGWLINRVIDLVNILASLGRVKAKGWNPMNWDWSSVKGATAQAGANQRQDAGKVAAAAGLIYKPLGSIFGNKGATLPPMKIPAFSGEGITDTGKDQTTGKSRAAAAASKAAAAAAAFAASVQAYVDKEFGIITDAYVGRKQAEIEANEELYDIKQESQEKAFDLQEEIVEGAQKYADKEFGIIKDAYVGRKSAEIEAQEELETLKAAAAEARKKALQASVDAEWKVIKEGYVAQKEAEIAVNEAIDEARKERADRREREERRRAAVLSAVWTNLWKDIQRGFESAVVDVLEGAKTWGDAMTELWREIWHELLHIMVQAIMLMIAKWLIAQKIMKIPSPGTGTGMPGGGGQGGGATSGMIQGAIAGAAWGPQGAAIGAAVGLIGSLFNFDQPRNDTAAIRSGQDLGRLLNQGVRAATGSASRITSGGGGVAAVNAPQTVTVNMHIAKVDNMGDIEKASETMAWIIGKRLKLVPTGG
jgi:tape measure domain-containing protein